MPVVTKRRAMPRKTYQPATHRPQSTYARRKRLRKERLKPAKRVARAKRRKLRHKRENERPLEDPESHEDAA
jgi:hypothetical protein